MPINETVYLHRKHRVCIGKNGTQKAWNRYSFWTHASDVEFDDGTTLASKAENMKGITNNIDSGAGFAADVSLVKSIRDSLKGLIDNLTNVVNGVNNRLGGLRFYEDSNGKWVVGADSVPKKLGSGFGGVGSVIIHALYPINIRNGEINNGSHPEIPSYWGMVSQYDLTWIEGYQELEFGIDGNVLAIPLSTKVNQDFEYTTSILPSRQSNFDGTVDMNGYLADKFDTYAAYAPHYLDEIKCHDMENGETSSINNSKFKTLALYNPNTGYLYLFSNGTCSFKNITIISYHK